jgi:hypothetical protein
VYGRDETIAEVRSRARAGVVVRGHGAGLGVAFIAGDADADFTEVTTAADGGRAALTALAGALATDVVPFDQRGCLSPRVALVEGPPSRAAAFAGALHHGLAVLGSRVPRGALTSDERSEATRWRETLAFAGRVWDGADHAVALAPRGMPLAVPPAGRHVLVAAVASASAARELLAPFARFVVSVGGRDSESLVAIAPTHARRARLGRMQRPPLDGPVDRRSL